MAKRNKIFSHILPEIESWPIAKMYEDRKKLIEDINNFTVEYLKLKHGKHLDKIISRTAYLELIRLKENPWKVDPPNEKQFWQRVKREIRQNNKHRDDIKEAKNIELLRRIVNRYSTEIAGKFVPKTFRFARKFLRGGFRRMLNTAAGRNHRRFWGSQLELHERLHLYGNIDLIRKLWTKGTIVVVPTHSSNLDSILIGYALDMMIGLPSFTYGAGLNLYDSEIVAYFMTRLGAYRVDRRKKNEIYLETLKTFSQWSVVKGVNSIFFPGGTRSRSGKLEQDLKLGLMSTLVSGQRYLFEQEKSDKKVIVVPLILSYNVVLEAQYLISSYLKSQGEENYVPSREESQSLRKIFSFAWQFFSKGSEISLSFGAPMDVFGNRLNEEGESINDHGNKIDISQYFKGSDQLHIRNQREGVYTTILADKIAKSYLNDNVILSSQIVAFVGFSILKKMNEDVDIFTLMSLPTEDEVFDREIFVDLTGQVISFFRKKEAENKIRIPEEFDSMMTEEVMIDGIKKLGIYHSEKPLKIRKDGHIISNNFKFLYYYYNRLATYKIEHDLQWNYEQLQIAEERLSLT